MPCFISFEGPEGSGKSTQARLLTSTLRDLGYDVFETREPGGTPLGEAVRDVALGRGGPPATPLAFALLMSASRAQLVAECLVPALDRGQTVIVDRFADSTLAYQAFGLGVPVEVVRRLTDIATGGIAPNFTIYVDIPPEIGLQRVKARSAGNKLDDADVAFHRKVRDGYREMMTWEPSRWISIDGNAPPDQVHAAILAAIQPRLERTTSTA